MSRWMIAECECGCYRYEQLTRDDNDIIGEVHQPEPCAPCFYCDVTGALGYRDDFESAKRTVENMR